MKTVTTKKKGSVIRIRIRLFIIYQPQYFSPIDLSRQSKWNFPEGGKKLENCFHRRCNRSPFAPMDRWISLTRLSYNVRNELDRRGRQTK